MLFSIIIPTYNRASILSETLLTVLNQTFTDYEIIVVDDGSTDDTEKAVTAFRSEKIKYFYKTNEERGVARNFGANKASGRYLIFLDSDDKMQPHHLKSINSFINGFNPAPEFIFSGYKLIKPDGNILYEYGLNGFFLPKKLFYGNFLGCSSVVITASLFKKYYFNTDRNLILFEDWELWLRIISDNKLYCFPNKSIIMSNHEGRSVLNYNSGQIDSKIIYFKNHILNSGIIKHSLINRQTFLMGIYSYASLHIAITKKNRPAAVKYLFMALINNPALLLKRRFYAIIKHLL